MPGHFYRVEFSVYENEDFGFDLSKADMHRSILIDYNAI